MQEKFPSKRGRVISYQMWMESATVAFLRFLSVIFNITAVIACLCFLFSETLPSTEDNEGLFSEVQQDDVEEQNF